MLKLLRSLVASKQSPEMGAPSALGAPPAVISAPGSDDYGAFATENLSSANGLPLLDWNAAQQWIDGISGEEAQAKAWSDCERAWLEHLREALGSNYRLREQGTAVLLSTLQGNVAEATLTFVIKTLQRVVRILDGVAHVPELTHACLSHLPVSAWLNEGIAVNTERRLCPPRSAVSTPQQMHARHCAFWGPAEVQQFWSGKSFLRTDEGNELSYDLARIIVSQFGADWDRFRPFVLSANIEDGGDSAATQHLGIPLGEVVCALLEQAPSPEWAPDPAAWSGAPERGAFSGRGLTLRSTRRATAGCASLRTRVNSNVSPLRDLCALSYSPPRLCSQSSSVCQAPLKQSEARALPRQVPPRAMQAQRPQANLRSTSRTVRRLEQLVRHRFAVVNPVMDPILIVMATALPASRTGSVGNAAG